MRRTFFDRNLPIDKHFAPRRDNAHRFGATHRPLKSKAPQDADISKGSPILLSKPTIPSPRGCDHLIKIAPVIPPPDGLPSG
jgi:hypothetical protein